MAAGRKRNKWLLGLSSITGVFIVVLLVVKAYVWPPSSQKYALKYPAELVELAASIGMEPLIEEEFLHNLTIYGGQGMPYVFGVLTQGKTPHSEVPASVLFWCQKDGKKYLVYAIRQKKDGKYYTYEVKNIFDEPRLYDYEDDKDSDYISVNVQTSRGMVIDESFLSTTKDLAHFSYLDDPSASGPKNIFPISKNGGLPVIIHGESATMVLYHYKGRWLRYIERDV